MPDNMMVVPLGQHSQARQMGRGGWSGHTVKEAFGELLKSQHKGTRAKYTSKALYGRYLRGVYT